MRFLLGLIGLVLLERGLALVIKWFEVLPVVVVLHYVVVLAIIAFVLFQVPGSGSSSGSGSGLVNLILVFMTLVLGSFVTNRMGAPEACQGFPYCNGRLIPTGELPWLHWMHRVVAGVTVIVMLLNTWRVRHAKVRNVAVISSVLMVAQAGVGAAMIVNHLPRSLFLLHQGLSLLIWVSTILWWKSTRSYYSS